MPPQVHAFWLARRGNSPDQYEDAFAADVATGRYAVADGATESSFAGLWARLLVEEFVQDSGCDPDQWPARLSTLQERWYADVSGRSLPWYAEAGVAQGAFAAFLGVVLGVTADASFCWQAVAVGDSCLFHTRGAALLGAFPLHQSGQFNNLPKLVGSRTSPAEICQKSTLWTDGNGRPGDRFWMMTDALAQWCLAEHEAGKNPWEEMDLLLAPPATQQRFTSWIEELRDGRGLQNDDVTLVVVNL